VIVLDTNVFVYALGGEHPLRDPCRALLRAVRERSIAATTTASVLQELAHLLGRRQPRDVVSTRVTDVAHVLRPVIPVTDAQVATALRVYRTYARLDAFDAFLVAAAIDAGADTLVSTDRDMHEITELHVLDPRDL
jgi:uncharacterized protein